MHFKPSSIFSLISLASSAFALKEGVLYFGRNFNNGTTVFTEIGNPSAAPVYEQWDMSVESLRLRQREAMSSNQKRFTDCWGWGLDASGVDKGVAYWDAWLRENPGGYELTSTDRNTAFAAVDYEAMRVYYCVNARRARGNMDLEDFRYAIGEMDRRCRAYEAGYFRWDGSPELVGKARSDTPICLG
jgi:hypothetical protein